MDGLQVGYSEQGLHGARGNAMIMNGIRLGHFTALSIPSLEAFVKCFWMEDVIRIDEVDYISM